MMAMMIFEVNLSEKAIKKLLFENVEFLQDYKATEDLFQKGIFTIRDLENTDDAYTLGIKNKAIWTARFSFYIENMLIEKNIPFKKKAYHFETQEEATTLFMQKYLI